MRTLRNYETLSGGPVVLNFADLMDDKLFTETLGDDVIYHASSGDLAIKAFVSKSVDPVFSGEAHLNEKRLLLDVAIADTPGLKKGSKFTMGGKKYTVDAEPDDDGHFAKLVLK